MRWWAGLLVGGIVACGNSPEPQPKPGGTSPPQALEIPPLDAGAPKTPQSLVVTPVPASTTARATYPRDEFDEARDPLAKRPHPDRTAMADQTAMLEKLLASTTTPDLARATLLKKLGDLSFRQSATLDGTDGDELRRDAIKRFTEIAQIQPQFPQIDEVNYYLGLAYEQNGDARNARKAYYDVIRSSPASTYVPYAYFAFGELFRREGETDPSKNELAQQAYREVMKYPQSAIAPFAKRRGGVRPKAISGTDSRQ